MEKGKIIVIDGLDGSGKHTQSELLLQYLTNKDYKCKLIAFPRYNSLTGAIVTGYLSGNLKQGNDFYSKIRTGMLYSYDRMFNMYFKTDANGKSIMDYYNEGYTIICDRYTSSNYLFMTHDMNYNEFKQYVVDMEELECTFMGLPKPDISLFLELPPQKSLELVEKRGNKKDIHETEEVLNKAYAAMQVYKKYCVETEDENDKKNYFINCMKNEIEMYSIEDISEMIKNVLQI
jgi:dTMP kinase